MESNIQTVLNNAQKAEEILTTPAEEKAPMDTTTNKAESIPPVRTDAPTGNAESIAPVRRAVDTARARPKEAPAIIRGESALTSRGFSFMRLLGAIKEKNWEYAKVERAIHDELESIGFATQYNGTLIPLDTALLERTYPQMKTIALREQMQAEYHPSFGMRRLIARALGETDDTKGGYLVSPEQSPDMIEMLRAQSVVERAGARVITLPKSGQLDIPRQTGGATGYWVGEHETITESEQVFDMLPLRVKYVAALVGASNRSLRHSTPSLEAVVREDVARVLALTSDLAFISGAGTANIPRGIINWAGINVINKNNAAITPDDLFNARRLVINGNGVPTAWIFNGDLEYKIYTLRAGALKSDDIPDYSVGDFLFNVDTGRVLNYPTFISTQIPTSGGKTFAILGMFSEAIIAREAVMEIAADTSIGFVKDQTFFRAILGCDFGLRTAPVFTCIKEIKVT